MKLSLKLTPKECIESASAFGTAALLNATINKYEDWDSIEYNDTFPLDGFQKCINNKHFTMSTAIHEVFDLLFGFTEGRIERGIDLNVHMKDGTVINGSDLYDIILEDDEIEAKIDYGITETELNTVC